MQHFDTIVVGVGGMGSAALWQLARRGQSVLGLDRFDLGHGMGSSHGLSRIIRLAYFEHPDYVPLLRRAYELWRETETLAGEQLLYVTGGLDAGPEAGRIVQGSLSACAVHELPHELLSAAEIGTRFPGYRLPEGYAGVYQADAGFVASERAILAYAMLAVEAGAELHGREQVIAIEPTGAGAMVITERGRYRAGKVIVSAGPWIADLLPGMTRLAIAERQVLGWFQPRDPALFTRDRFPVSNLETDIGQFYQFPMWGIPGFKIGIYNHFREQGHADALSRDPTAIDEAALRMAIQRFFPEADGPTLRLATCLFTNAPDEHFILDALPEHPQIIIASPCSGHGFKFASVIGEILADMATDSAVRQKLSLFSYDRFDKGSDVL